jgi:hypothetical protein
MPKKKTATPNAPTPTAKPAPAPVVHVDTPDLADFDEFRNRLMYDYAQREFLRDQPCDLTPGHVANLDRKIRLLHAAMFGG